MKPDIIGWMATATFSLSYLFKTPVALRRVQAMGAGLWLAYGVSIGSLPVIVANVIVVSMALFSALQLKPNNQA